MYATARTMSQIESIRAGITVGGVVDIWINGGGISVAISIAEAERLLADLPAAIDAAKAMENSEKGK